MRSNLSMVFFVGRAVRATALARHGEVDARSRGVTLTRLTDLGRVRPSIRCHVRVANLNRRHHFIQCDPTYRIEAPPLRLIYTHTAGAFLADRSPRRRND